MADDPATRPIRRIKIKFGSTVVATQAVRVTGLAGSASQDSKDTKSGSALHLARSRQASLQGYVPPSASADAIVARLRLGEGFAPGAELPAWDFKAPPQRVTQERPSKRSRQTASPRETCLESLAHCAGPEPVAVNVPGEGPLSTSRRLEPAENGTDAKQLRVEPVVERAAPAGASGESNSDQATNSQAYLPLSPDGGAEGAGRTGAGSATQPHASSAGQSSLASSALHSSIASRRRPTTAAASLMPSFPESASVSASAASEDAKEPGSAVVLQALSARASVARFSSQRRTTDPPPTWERPGALSEAAAPAAPPITPSGVSVETQTTQRDFPILPTSFLELPRLSGTALSYQSIGPFDLQLEQERQAVPEGRVDAHIEEARRMKREGDALCSRNGKIWTIKSLSKYVSASLMFMEAAEAMLREQRRESRSRAGDMYRQTADLLGYTVSYTDMLKGNGIGKEALRLLAERLCAICLMRQAALMASNFRLCAERAQAALREHHRQQQQGALGQGTGAAATCTGVGQQPSPEDSSTSSLHIAHGGGSAFTSTSARSARGGGGGSSTGGPNGTVPNGTAANGGGSGVQALPGFGHEQVSELLTYARTTSRFCDFMKRSNKSFEAFLERSDVRQDQQAKLVCMHLAAVCMDVGMNPGMRVIQHAREAVRTLCDDLAR